MTRDAVPDPSAGGDDARLLGVLLANTPVVLFEVDRDGVFTRSEGRGLAAFGVLPGERVGVSALEFHRDHPKVLECFRRALEGESVQAELEIEGATFEVHWEPVRDALGAVTGVTGVGTDVSARARYESQLAESEHRFRQMADHIQDVFWMYEPAAARVLYASPAFEAVFGRTRQRLYEDTRTFLDAIHPEDRERLGDVAERHLAGQTTDEVYRVVRPDGSVRWVRDRGFPVGGPDGAARRVVGLTQDITLQHAAEEQLRRTVSRLEATLESSADGLLVVDEEWRVTAFNARCAEMWGLSTELLAHGSLHSLRDSALAQLEDREAVVEHALRVVLDPGLAWSESVTLRDGRVFECYSLPQRVGGTVAGRVFSFRDVTERRRAEERLRAREDELRHAQKMDALGRLAGGIAHDFNNLLTAILGHAQLLADALPAGEERESALEIQTASQRAAQLTRQLLTLGRKQAARPATFDLGAVVEEALPMLRAVLGEGIQVEASGGTRPAWVRLDRGEAEQLLMNLVVNARDAMAGHGMLRVELSETERPAGSALHAHLAPGPYVVLRVSDNGCGMSEAVRARLFEPFFTTKERGQGLGLGLAMAFATMTRCGGCIEVESRPGQGATFTLLFPRADESASEGAGAADGVRPPGGRERVLVVEDEEVVRLLIARLLTGLGYEVTRAASPAEALEEAARGGPPPDLLVTDMVMPGRTGLGLTQALRARWPELPVVCISGYADDETTRRMLELPGVSFVAKPFSPDTLARVVRERLDARARPGT